MGIGQVYRRIRQVVSNACPVDKEKRDCFCKTIVEDGLPTYISVKIDTLWSNENKNIENREVIMYHIMSGESHTITMM